MSIVVKACLLLFTGTALGLGYNAWPALGLGSSIHGEILGGSVDVVSYAIGLIVGMVLWQAGSVQWAALPTQMHQYLMSQMHFYQFIALGAGCLFVLVYV
jgi:hypothetical protein